MRPIGVFGGTFDPVHLGHLRSALELQELLRLERVHFIPCAEPPHRDQPRVAGAQRLDMLDLAVRDQPAFVCDDRELRRGGRSYMFDTLSSLRAEYRDTPLCLMLGLDAFLDLRGWHRWEELPELAHLVVARRPGRHPGGAGDDAEQTLLRTRRTGSVSDLHEQSAGRVFMAEVTQLDISATDIRARLAAGRSIRYLVTDRVADHIERRRLYQEAPPADNHA